MDTLQRILSYSKTYKLFWMLSIVGFLMAAVGSSLNIWMVHNLTLIATLLGSSEGMSEQVQNSAFWLPFQVVAVFVFLGVSNFFASYFNERLSYEVAHDIRLDFFKHLQFSNIQFIKNVSTGEMLSKLIYNIEIIRTFYAGFITSIFKDTLTIIGSMAWALYYNWQLTLIFFTIIPFISISVTYGSKFYKKYNQKVQQSLAQITETFNENVKGQEVIRVYTQQNNQIKKFGSQSHVNKSQSIKLIVTRSISILFINTISGIGIAIVIWSAFKLKVTVSELIAVFTALISCARPFKNLARLSEQFSKIKEAANMLFEQLDQPVETNKGQLNLSEKKCVLTVRNLEFKYPSSTKNVLNDINFEVQSGQTIALVGRSGSGKSTLIQLIVRLFNAQSGKISINNQSIDQFTLDSLRTHIALVTQQPIIFAGSLYDNIAFGQPHANEEKVIHAAKLAHVWEFAKDLEGGIYANIQADGSNLSGGQKQRIAIARAFLKDAPILLLDEATSALDNQSEAKVQQALTELMKNKTTLVIAHRLSTIKHADKILVLEDGEIKQTGDYESLSQEDGLFKIMLSHTD
ncbi:MAG: ATP-binding cassette domain-containing protein [Saccharospirillaceae bacterium]|nr:ABC transporter ATP-binding protein/permease [Pseudomonadales bacterium]NRB77902.1 ATP-binding cassette domain-containing protein [Saccharospirillaceae bacterium]